MDSPVIWVLIALVLIGAVVWITISRMRSQRLRQRFGSEYERAIREEGTVRKAEAALEQRARRVAKLHIRPLAPSDAARFDHDWRAVQARFVDDPRGAVTEADRLVGEVMAARGYPVGEFEQRVADISVDHPDVVVNYRAAREIALLHAAGKADTEDLRQAMVHYGALFRDLLETTSDEIHDDIHREHARHDHVGDTYPVSATRRER
jgi:hypothetical protein